MADRRMLSQTLMEALNMVVRTKDARLQYTHIVLRTDDDGLCEISEKLCKDLELDAAAVEELENAGYIYIIPDEYSPGKPQIAVDRQWHVTNKLRYDRYRENSHQYIIDRLYIGDNGVYYLENENPPGLKVQKYRDYLNQRKEASRKKKNSDSPTLCDSSEQYFSNSDDPF